MSHSRSTVAILLLALSVAETGCLFRTRIVEMRTSTAKLQTATKQELIDRINSEATSIKTLNATVNIATSVGGERKGKVTEYEEIRGYILVRKPDMLRMIGLFPIVRNKAFDMVSDGNEFKLWIPAKNRFVTGRNDMETTNPKQPLESIRPQNLYEALLIREIDPANEIAVLEHGYETVLDSKRHRVDQPDYEIVVVRRGKTGWFLSRKIVFSRIDLEPHRQMIYDEGGKLATDVRYGEYKDYDGIRFSTQTEIERPQEGYDITLNVLKLDLNNPLTDDQFELAQPEGAEVVHLGQAAQSRIVDEDPK
jgi:outer membrane lipoprotein-sorting protein